MSSFAYDINEQGQVVGYAGGGAFGPQAFLWTPPGGNSPAMLTELDKLPGGVTSTAYGINDLGQIVGESDSTAGNRAFLFTPASGTSSSSMIDLGVLGSPHLPRESVAHDINNAGVIVGTSIAILTGGTRSRSAFIYQNGQMQSLSSIASGGGNLVEPWAINKNGEIVGQIGAVSSFKMWDDGFVTQLDSSAGPRSIAFDANNNGEVVGWMDVDSNAIRQVAYISKPTKQSTHLIGSSDISYGTLGGNLGIELKNSYAYGINDAGLVVGTSEWDGPGTHAFIFDGTAMNDLNAQLDDSGLGWTLEEARAINNAGQIVGWGRFGAGGLQTRAFLLTPVSLIPEPAGATTLAVALLILLPSRRRAANS